MTIEVSGGGAVAVTTEALLDAERMLGATVARSHDARAFADGAAALVAVASPEASGALRLAARELGDLADDAHRLACDVRTAAEAYGWAERAAAVKQQLIAGFVGPGAELAGALAALAGTSARRGELAYDDAHLTAALRELADSVSLPLLVAGVQALPGAALEETRVDAVRVRGASVPSIAPPPSGFAALAHRIPAAEKDAPQVRVERYVLADGEVHWLVYVAGTSDWSLTPGADPWDDTSNAVGLAGGSAGATRATIAALANAGWKPGEPVLPVGHSQGGIVASALASSGVVSVPMLVTFGSPAIGAGTARGIVDVAVEHRDDPVPALGGSPRVTDHRLVVRDTAPAVSGGGAVPSHAMSGYAQTARQLDASSDGRVNGARETLAGFTGGQRAEVTLWRGERLHPRATAHGE